MDELQGHNRHAMRLLLKNFKNHAESIKNISSVYDPVVITDRYIRKRFLNFYTCDTLSWDKPRPENPSIDTYIELGKYNLRFCPVAWGCRIHRQHLCRRVKTHPTSVLDMMINNVIAKLQSISRIGECRVPLHCHRTQVYSGQLRASYLYIK